MNTLRAKISALVVGAILTVICFALGLLFVVIRPPTYERLIEIKAHNLSVIIRSNSGNAYKALEETTLTGMSETFGIRSEPAEGEISQGMTQSLTLALRELGIDTQLIVNRRTAERHSLIASVALPDGKWLVLPMSMPPPFEELLPFLIVGGLVLVVGLIIIALAVVSRLMRPFALIERSVAKIDLKGDLPVLIETGPADIRATARAINLLSSRLKTAMESRMRLVAAAGHDFRTPMTRMRLRAEFLDEPDREKFLSDINELDYIADSAIRLVQEEIEGCDGEVLRLDCLLQDVVGELKDMQIDASMTEADPVRVIGKPLSLKRAIRNLVINAATHGGGATVSMRRNCKTVVIDIIDRGPGIPEELIARACEPFFRVNEARSPKDGAGLGLAIANEIIKRHHGELTLVNRLGGGLAQRIQMSVG
ncbi:MAG: two-component sensor histidine kinase [Hyphomicrobiales bacterium]|nr:two-component sensor histidine kinase [Hyphomicrobiales bacterium]